MPSLQALGEFKASFGTIGDELHTLAELELPLDDFPLPNHEPAAGLDLSRPADSTEAIPMDTNPPDVFGPPAEAPLDTATAVGGSPGDGADFINFGDLGDLLGGMDTQLSDFTGKEDVFSENGEDFPSEETTDPGDEESLSDFLNTIPDDLSPPADEEPDTEADGGFVSGGL
jgi:hypothetical protein